MRLSWTLDRTPHVIRDKATLPQKRRKHVNQAHTPRKRRRGATNPAVQESLIVRDCNLVDVAVLHILREKVQLVAVVKQRSCLTPLTRQVPEKEVDRVSDSRRSHRVPVSAPSAPPCSTRRRRAANCGARPVRSAYSTTSMVGI